MALILVKEKHFIDQTTQPGDAAEQIFQHWQHVFNKPRARLDEARRKIIKVRLADGYTPQDLQDAISGCYLSEFHQGDNDRGRKFNDLGLILRDAAHVDNFIELYEDGLTRLVRQDEAAAVLPPSQVSTKEHILAQLEKMKKLLGRRQ